MVDKTNQNISEAKFKILFAVSFCHFLNDTIQANFSNLSPSKKLT